MKDSGTIGQIRCKLPGILKYRVALTKHNKLLNNLSRMLNYMGIQNILHFEFTAVISLRVERSIQSIYNTNSRLKQTNMKYIMNDPVIW